MDGTTTMQGTEQEVQNTATETQGQQTAESTPEKVSTLQKFIDGLFGGGKKAEGAEPEKKDGDPVAEKAEEEKSFTQADVDAAIEAAKQQWLDEAAEYGALKLMMLPSISRSGLPFTAIQIVSSNFSVKAIIQL